LSSIIAYTFPIQPISAFVIIISLDRWLHPVLRTRLSSFVSSAAGCIAELKKDGIRIKSSAGNVAAVPGQF
jgi:hypothetical protein